jgi:hypothetical protein
MWDPSAQQAAARLWPRSPPDDSPAIARHRAREDAFTRACACFHAPDGNGGLRRTHLLGAGSTAPEGAAMGAALARLGYKVHDAGTALDPPASVL